MTTPAPAPAAAPANAAPSNAAPVVDPSTQTPAPATPPVTPAPPQPAPKKEEAPAKPGAEPKEPPKAVEITKDDLKLPEGSLLDPKTVDEIVSFSKEKGLSKEAAQAILERESKLLSSHAEGEKAKLTQAQNSWTEGARTDKEIGGENFAKNAELAKRVFVKFGSESLQKMMDESKLGNHPEVLRFAYRVGKAMGEDDFVLPDGQASGEKKDAATLLFGKTAPENKESK